MNLPKKAGKKNGPPRDDEDNARADAIAEARRDAEAEIEAVEHHGDVTPPPEIPARVSGPAAATGDRARALVQKEANDKAAEAEKKAAKLTAELEVAKALLQKERKKRQRENEEEALISKPRRSSSTVVSSRKKAVSTVNYVIKFQGLTFFFCASRRSKVLTSSLHCSLIKLYRVLFMVK